MDKVVNARTPVISSRASVPHAALTLAELNKHLHSVQPKSAWKKGKRGHWSLPLFFNDGATGTTRPLLVDFKGFSNFGLSMYEGEDKDDKFSSKDEEEKPTTKKKPYVKPFTIALDFDSSPEVHCFNALLNAAVSGIMTKQLPLLQAQVAPEDTEIQSFQRKVARASSGSSVKNVRIKCYPGSTQLEEDGKQVSMEKFTKKAAGDYRVIVDAAAIDASMSEGQLTYGPVLYGRVIKLLKEEVRKPLQFREEAGQGEESWTSIPSEEELDKRLKAKRIEKEKAEKEKKKEKKKRKADE